MSNVTITHYSITVRGSVAILGLRAFGPITKVVTIAPQPVRGNGGVIGRTRGKYHWAATMYLDLDVARAALSNVCDNDAFDVVLHYVIDDGDECVFASKDASVDGFSAHHGCVAVRLGFNDEPPADIVGREFRIQSEESP